MNSEHTRLKLDIDSNEAVLSKKVGQLEFKLDTNSQLCSTNPNKIAKKYRGDLMIKQGNSKSITSVTCTVKRVAQD